MPYGLDGRWRDENGRIDLKHRNTRIKHLREHYRNFAPGWDGDATLGQLLDAAGCSTLDQYLHHHHHG